MKRKPRQTSRKRTGKVMKVSRRTPLLERVNPHAAGIDVGSKFHLVAVPPESTESSVREFGVMTEDLLALSAWLRECGVTSVVMESTGVYWIPLFEVLEAAGFEVLLVDARKVKNVSGRKSDVLDCQWLQELHTFGLLAGAFRPPDEIMPLRAYLRQRKMLVEARTMHRQHMAKALQQMNLRLDNVISELTGVTGLAILRSIVAGERDPAKLARYRDPGCHATEEEIRASLVGNYRDEHLFALRQALSLYDLYTAKITECEEEMGRYLKTLGSRTDKEMPPPPDKKESSLGFDVREHLFRQLGTDMLRIKGINAELALEIYSETGRDLAAAFGNVRRFCSWLGLCPGTKKSGGKILSSKTKRNACRAAVAFRQAAVCVGKTNTALGAFYRRMNMRLGKMGAVTATAHKLARIWYSMVTQGANYDEAGAEAYEKKYQSRVVRNLEKKAKSMGYTLTPITAQA
ncbi:MAG: IS110 family transposase [Blastocatellia bacterium]